MLGRVNNMCIPGSGAMAHWTITLQREGAAIIVWARVTNPIRSTKIDNETRFAETRPNIPSVAGEDYTQPVVSGLRDDSGLQRPQSVMVLVSSDLAHNRAISYESNDPCHLSFAVPNFSFSCPLPSLQCGQLPKWIVALFFAVLFSYTQ